MVACTENVLCSGCVSHTTLLKYIDGSSRDRCWCEVERVWVQPEPWKEKGTIAQTG
jgi:LSD1 subclass zinc finger protein